MPDNLSKELLDKVNVSVKANHSIAGFFDSLGLVIGGWVLVWPLVGVVLWLSGSMWGLFLAVGAMIVSPFLLWHHSNSKLSRELPLLVIWGVFGIFLLVSLGRYPVFPPFYSADFVNHLKYGWEFASGLGRLIPLYSAGDLVVSTFLSGEMLGSSMREGWMWMVWLAVPLWYVVGLRVSGGRRIVGLWLAFLYVGGGSIWYHLLFSTGLLSNFYSVLLALATLVVFIEYSETGRKRLIPFLALAGGVGLISHYSYPLFAVSLMIVAARQRPVSIVPYMSPVIGGVVLASDRLGEVVGVLSAPGGNPYVYVPNFLTAVLSPTPILQNVAVAMQSPWLSLIVFATAGVGVYGVVKHRGWGLMPLLWFAVTVGVSFIFDFGWRMSYALLPPLWMLSALGVGELWAKLG